MVLRTSAVPAHAGPASCARILRARHHEIRCSYNRHIQRARQMKGVGSSLKSRGDTRARQ